jgi:hypothetical protein
LLAIAEGLNNGMTSSSLPEPDRYGVEPTIEARARSWLSGASAGALDCTQLDPGIVDVWTDEQARRWSALIRPLGEPLDFYPFQAIADVNGVQYFFRVRYASATMTWVFSLSPSGKVNGFGLRKSWNNRLASIMLRDVTGY